jgi:hypothetical protein
MILEREAEVNNFKDVIVDIASRWKTSFKYREMDDRQLLFCLVRLRALARDTVARGS